MQREERGRADVRSEGVLPGELREHPGGPTLGDDLAVGRELPDPVLEFGLLEDLVHP